MVFSSLRRHSGRAGSTSGMGNYTAHYVDLPVGMRKGKSWQERLIPDSRIARAAVLVAIVQGLIALALEIVITVFHLQQHDNANFTHRVGMDGMDDGGITMMRRMNLSISVLVYHYIFMCAQLFYVTMTWDAVLRKNTLQMIGVSIFSFVTIAYTYIQSNQHAKMNMNDINHLAMVHSVFVHNTVPYEMTLIGVVAVGSVAMSALTWELYQEFGWKIYKKLGADLQIIRMYRVHQMATTFLKFAAFFFISFPIQLVAMNLHAVEAERYIQIIAIPLCIIMIVLAIYALHMESKPALLTYMVMLALIVSYMLYKLVDIVRTEDTSENPDLDKDPYTASRESLLFFLSVTLILCVVSSVLSIFCYNNFDLGLLDHRRQHKLGKVAVPMNATEEEARRISLMVRNSVVSQRVELD